MLLEEKYSKWCEIFWKYFVIPSNENERGSNIPLGTIDFDSLAGTVGDGTCNLADLLQYLYAAKLNNEVTEITLEDGLKVIDRLSLAAYNYFRSAFPKVYYLCQEPGFFFRDDILNSDSPKLGLSKIISSYSMLVDGLNEDPCHSQFISQDQVWNLNPILAKIMREDEDPNISSLARTIGININEYIMRNEYTIYNPYLSAINHYFHYCPTFNENKVKPWERISDRNKHLKYTDKVKRGANNWYYSGCTSACYDSFNNMNKGYHHTFRTFLQRGVLFMLDRLYEPILGLFGSEFKHNSYYCYASTSGLWYGPNFEERLSKRFNESVKRSITKETVSEGDLFEYNIIGLIDNPSLVDWTELERWLELYPDPEVKGVIDSPIHFMYLYNWYLKYKDTERIEVHEYEDDDED